MKGKHKAKKKFFVSPYLLSLSLFMWALILPTTGMLKAWMIQDFLQAQPPGVNLWPAFFGSNEFWVFMLFDGLTVLLLVGFILTSDQMFARVEICDDGIIFRALFRRTRRMAYAQMNVIGIDFAPLTGSRQFWIYFSKIEIPYKYFHKINNLPINNDTLRVQYSDKIYNALLYAMPPEQAKLLNRAHSTLRAYRYNESDE